ncbi:hypothetical protein EB796_001146 [Bugula neritina]|uniref:Uncharacterized protein n=1 Tax=Bugula neritina TaxID=10212 RepID=A0A7J7KQR8_BUGNE|nr:hypothetical protein EB796_001146 [Bugula neritina]
MCLQVCVFRQYLTCTTDISLAKKDAELKQSNQTVSELKERLSRSKYAVAGVMSTCPLSTCSDLSASQDELSSTRQELNSANQNLIDSSKKFKETAKQLREVKDHLHKVQEEHGKFLSELQQTTSSLKKKDEQKEMAQAEVYSIWDSFSKAEDELRASQTELRIAKEELARKTNGQVEQRKRLIQLESEREAVLRRRETLPFLAQELQAPPVVSADYGGRLHDTLMAGKQSPVPSLHNYVFAFTNGDNADAGLGLRAECELIELLKLNITQINELLLLKQELLAPGRFAVSHQAGNSVSHHFCFVGVPIQPVHSQSLPLSVKHKLSTPSFQAHHSKQPISFSDQLNTSGNNATDQSLADYNTAGPMARNSYMVSHDVSTGQVSQGAPELATINGVTYQQVPSSRVPPASSTQLLVTSSSLIVPEFQSFQQAPAQSSATGYKQAYATSYQKSPATDHQQTPATSYQKSPATGNQQTSVSGKQYSLVVGYQQAPVSGHQYSFIADSQQAPVSFVVT